MAEPQKKCTLTFKNASNHQYHFVANDHKERDGWVKDMAKVLKLIELKEKRIIAAQAKTEATPPQILSRAKSSVNTVIHDAYLSDKKGKTKTMMDKTLEAGVFDISKMGTEHGVIELPAFDPSEDIEEEIKMRKHIMWHLYTLRIGPIYLARSNHLGDLKDTHAYQHIESINVESEHYASVEFVKYVPTVSWYFYSENMQAIISSIYSASAKQGHRIHLTGISNVIENVRSPNSSTDSKSMSPPALSRTATYVGASASETPRARFSLNRAFSMR